METTYFARYKQSSPFSPLPWPVPSGPTLKFLIGEDGGYEALALFALYGTIDPLVLKLVAWV